MGLIEYTAHSKNGHVIPDSKVDGAKMGPIWSRQVGPMNRDDASLVAVTGKAIIASCIKMKSSQLIWKLGIRRFHPQCPIFKWVAETAWQDSITTLKAIIWHDPTSSWYCDRNKMTSSNGSIFRVTGLLCGEFTGHRWIPLTKASDAELWCFLLICTWINGWVNNRGAGDLGRHDAHYDVTVMNKMNTSYQCAYLTGCWCWCPNASYVMDVFPA